jgi:hypothetical protein
MGRRLAGGYTSVALPARELAATTPRQRILIRGRSLIALAAVTAVLIAVAILLPPFVPAGADLKDTNQAAYVRAIWPETQISLAVLMIFLPSLCYAIAAGGAAWGRLLIGSASLLGVAVATFYVVISLQSYIAKPEVVYGSVTSLNGRTVCLQYGTLSLIVGNEAMTRCFALDVPSEELRGAQNWVQQHEYVEVLVSPRGHVGFIAPISGALQ